MGYGECVICEKIKRFMKPVIKINFADFWPHFNKEDNFFTQWLSRSFRVELSGNPDFLIYSCYGSQHLDYSCYRIFYNGENMRVNWNACDFAFGFDYLDDERYYRLPNWFWYADPRLLLQERPQTNPDVLQNRKFCNIVVSNGLSKKRIDFFQSLSRYRKVDSGGKYLNNIGGPVDDKLAFIKNYKFTIAFENSSYPGYTTEKIFEPLLAGSIPVYWGNPLVGKDFNTGSFVNAHDYASNEALIERIIELDKNDDLYTAMLKQPAYPGNRLPSCMEDENIQRQWEKIINTAANKQPVAKSIRKVYYSVNRFFSKIDFHANHIFRYRKNFR
jgi:hypothetical protein